MTFIANDIQVISGMTVNTLNAVSVSGTTMFGDGGALTNIPDTYPTATTFNQNVMTVDFNDGSQLTGAITGLTGVTIQVTQEQLLIDGLSPGDSSLKHWGEMFEDANTLTTAIGGAGTPVKTNTTSNLGGARGFTMPIDNRLTYTASTTGQTFEITGTISGEAASGSQAAQFMIYKNGTEEITATICYTEWSSSSRALAITGTLTLGENDYIELWCQNNTSNKDLELKTFTVRIAQI